MSGKCYHVIFTGALLPGVDHKTVLSNLVLEVGMSEAKAMALLNKQQVLLKRFEDETSAKRLADKFLRAGMHCVVDMRGGSESDADSILMSIITKLTKPADKK